MSNFNYLDRLTDFANLKEHCALAERLVLSCPSSCAISCGNGLDYIIKFIYLLREGALPKTATLMEIIDNRGVTEFIGDYELKESLHYIRILGNNAGHGLKVRKKEAKIALMNLHFFIGASLIKLNIIESFQPFSDELLTATKEFTEVSLVNIEIDSNLVNSYKTEENKTAIINYIKPQYMSEASTRRLYIDLYLREAGWIIAERENVVVPASAGIEIRVEGMPNVTGEGYCDYVLYGRDGRPLAIVEAKKTGISPEKGRHQVNLYGECLKVKYGYTPILYYTNGYIIKIMDGIYPDRTLTGFHSIDELELLLQRRDRGDITDLRIKDNITNRAYQKIAITNICERLNLKYRKGLLVMATGTGKTRVAISLVDVLTRNSWIKNILFLADRTSLVSQAKRNFVKFLPNISVCELSGSSEKDMTARLMFSTYQTMINYIDKEDKGFTIGRFDLVIIDEAHRSIFNKYSSIFAYFDSLLIGLTATPKSEVDFNTYNIFDCESGIPNFDYSLEEAVNEKFLVNYRVVNRTTKFLKRGIKYNELSEEDKRKYEESFGEIEDNPQFEISSSLMFRTIYNEDTCDKILEELMTYGIKIDNGEKLGKTIIFAYNHLHAQMIVERFRFLYPNYDSNFCQLIDNYVNYADSLILNFETKSDFQIAVSVDMLDTGIDIPDIVNLVFFKPVKSKTKFVQMIGRGTRLRPDLFGRGKDKQFFLIFDYCGNFDYFDKNPEGSEGSTVKSLTAKLYERRLDILYMLQDIEHQEIEFNRNYYLSLKDILHSDVIYIKSHSTRISVRLNMGYVDKYCDKDTWQNISVDKVEEIRKRISPLLDSDIRENDLNKIFDLKMLNIELSMLMCGNTGKASRDVITIREIARYLLTKASIPQVIAKAESLRTLASEQLWLNPSIERLEQLREDVRELMQFLKESCGLSTVKIDLEDELEDSDNHSDGIIDIRTYREKVIDYLAKNTDSEVIRKINRLEPIDSNDLRELESILWQELGSRDEYYKIAETDNLAVFVRSLIGLNQEAINVKFGEFLSDNVLNSKQQEFIKAIINYVRENGDIRRENLIEPPFDNHNITELFGDRLDILLQIVNTMHNVVTISA